MLLLLLPLLCRLDKLKGQKFFSTSPQHTHEHYMQVDTQLDSSGVDYST
jgi:hypothetical protein